MNGVAIAICAISLSLADGEPVVYSDPLMHFSLKVPADWKRLSHTEVRRALDDMGDGGHLDAWFQPQTDQLYSAHCLKVDHREKTTTLQALQELLVRGREANLAALRRTGGEFRQTIPTIDARRNLVSYTLEQRKLNGPWLTTKVAQFPCRSGVVELLYFCPQSNGEAGKLIRQEILESTKFEAHFGYEPAELDETKQVSVVVFVGVIVVGVLLVGISAYWLRTRSKRLMK